MKAQATRHVSFLVILSHHIKISVWNEVNNHRSLTKISGVKLCKVHNRKAGAGRCVAPFNFVQLILDDSESRDYAH